MTRSIITANREEPCRAERTDPPSTTARERPPPQAEW